MLKLTAILGLAATATAVDSVFNLQQSCVGPTLVCTDLPENICCSVNDPQAPNFSSVFYSKIPAGRRIQTTVWDGPHCEVVSKFPAGLPSSTDSICVPYGEDAKSTRYNFVNSKRDEESVFGSREPDTLILADGTKYNIAELAKKDLRTLVSSFTCVLLANLRR